MNIERSQRAALENLSLLSQKPMGMRVKSGAWLRGELFHMSTEYAQLAELVLKTVAADDALSDLRAELEVD